MVLFILFSSLFTLGTTKSVKISSLAAGMGPAPVGFLDMDESTVSGATW